MTAPRRLVLDWRGTPDLTKLADFYSVFWTAGARPVTGTPDAKVLGPPDAVKRHREMRRKRSQTRRAIARLRGRSAES